MSYNDRRWTYKQDLGDPVLENMPFRVLKRIARSMDISTANKKRIDLINAIKRKTIARGTLNLPDLQVSSQQVYNQQFTVLQKQQNSFQVQQLQRQMELFHIKPMNVPLQPVPNLQCSQRMVQTSMNSMGYPEQTPLGAASITARWPPMQYQNATLYNPPLQTATNSLHALYPNFSTPGFSQQTSINGAHLFNNQNQIFQHPNLSLQTPYETTRTNLIFNCPIVDCSVKIPLFELAGHIQSNHEEEIGFYFEWETRFKLTDFYESHKKLHIQSINNRMFVTTIDFVKGFLHVEVRHLPDGCKESTTAILQFKRQDHVVYNWEVHVPSYEEFMAKNISRSIYLGHYDETEQLSVKSIIL